MYVRVRAARHRIGRVVAVAFVAAALACACAAPAGAQSQMPAQSARAFGDSIGVNVRLTYLNSSYGDFDKLYARLHELGVRYVSDSLCPTCTYQVSRLQRLAASGIRSNLGIGWWNGGSASIAAGLKGVKDQLRGSVVSLTGLNETDLTGDPQWVQKTRDFHADLYHQAKADPALAGLPVIGPSLVYRGSRAALGDMSAFVDRGNIHPYPGGLPPLQNLEDERQLMAPVTGNKPLVATEVGYHTDLAHPGPHRPASEQAVGIYMPRIVLEAFRFGVERTYIYQLADLWSDADAQRYGYPASQNSFGLLRWNLEPKPAFIALRNLLRVVDGDSAPVASAGGLRIGLEGAGPDVRKLLLRSADGSYALALWRDVSVWDRTAQVNLAPAPDRVDVAIGEPIALARRFDPVSSDDESQRWTNPHRISIDLAGAPVVLRLTPEGVSPGGGGKGGDGSLRAGERRRARCPSGAIAGSSSKHKRAKHEQRGKRRKAAKRRKAQRRCCRSGRVRKGARRHGRRRARARSATWKAHGGCASRRRR